MERAIDQMTEKELARPGGADDSSGFGALSTDKGMLPLEAMGISAKLEALAARIELVQRFRNTLDEPLEATYIFPLPDRAAVTAFQLQVGDRKIEGVIQERGQARRAYTEALESGQRAAITEEDRSGVFTMRVGNLMPGEIAEVRFTLVGPLPIEDGDVTFRFPLVVAPRYVPGAPLRGESVGDGTTPDTDLVPDASRISPPVLLPGFPNPVRLSLVVDLEETLPISNLRCSLHSVVEERRGRGMRIALNPGERLNRDFILRYRLGDGQTRAALHISHDEKKASDGNDGTFSLSLLPPRGGDASRARDVVFVLDRSGSMSGWKMVAARRAVGRMIDTLGDADRFAVLAFDNSIEQPPGSPGLRAASDRNRFRCIEWLGGVDARGGTEMLEPLHRAARELAASSRDRDRTLVLITDGQVGNEDHLLRSLSTDLEGVRVHSLGIDRAVNAGFLRRFAAMGGGSASLVESEDRLDEVLGAIHRRISTPVVTEISLVGQGIEIDQRSLAPRRSPDLFDGSPTVVRGRFRGGGGSIAVQGADATGETVRFTVEGVPGEEDIDRPLWARSRVRMLEDEYAIGRGDLAALSKQIVSTSLEFGVLCRFTAYVAIDTSEVVNADGERRSLVQPVELPDGWGGEAERDDREAAPAAAPGMMYSMAMPSPMAQGGRPAASAPPAPPVARSTGRRRMPDMKAKKKDAAAEAMISKVREVAARITGRGAAEEKSKVEGGGVSLAAYLKRVHEARRRAMEGIDPLAAATELCRALQDIASDLAGMGDEAAALARSLREIARNLQKVLGSGGEIPAALQRAIERLESHESRSESFWK